MVFLECRLLRFDGKVIAHSHHPYLRINSLAQNFAFDQYDCSSLEFFSTGS